MRLYIDPGTGSMLFAMMIGIFGAVTYLLKMGIIKLRTMLSIGKSAEQSERDVPLAIFADDKRYWPVFEPICRELDRRGFEVSYLTASPNDPALDNPYTHIHGEFIGEGNKAFARLNFLKATMLLSTTPGLDIYQWKRSRQVKYYVHIPHAASDITLYHMFGIDYYDAILLSGVYQAEQVRKLERLRNLPVKEIVKVGIPYMDEMRKRLENAPTPQNHERTVLLAPSWGKSAIFSVFGGKIIDILLKSGFHVIVRPHPQSFSSEKELLSRIMDAYPPSEQLEWNRDTDNFEVLRRADILISDFSGVIFDFALVFDKPVIYADTQFDPTVYDAWWLEEPLWTFGILPQIGMQLTAENMDQLKEMIGVCLTDPRYTYGREQARKETWAHMGEGASRTADYLITKYQDLAKEEQK